MTLRTRIATLLCALLLSACGALKPSTEPPPALYALDATLAPATPLVPPGPPGPPRPTLIITPPRAAAGFDSQRMVYQRRDHQLEFFAHSEWVDTPARMLGPLLASAAQASQAFGAVVLTPAGAKGDLRLETEVVRLLHDFQQQPSRVQFVLRATLMDDKTRRVLAWHEFQGDAAAASDTPQAGVAAANQAVRSVLIGLAQFAAQNAR